MKASLLVLVSVCVSVASGKVVSGKTVVWKTQKHKVGRKLPVYDTRSHNGATVSESLSSFASGEEVLVAICSSSDLFSGSDVVSTSIANSESSLVMPNVYNAIDSVYTDLCQAVSKSASMNGHSVVDMDELLKQLSEQSQEMFSNNKLDAFLVNSPVSSAQMSSLVTLLDDKSAVLVNIQNSDVATPESFGEYHRVLESHSTDPTNSTYLPEGTEFSIYYNNQYLYITPDIFTGLMTGLFMFFVVYFGFSCLGEIKGNNTYASKMPTLGKEG